MSNKRCGKLLGATPVRHLPRPVALAALSKALNEASPNSRIAGIDGERLFISTHCAGEVCLPCKRLAERPHHPGSVQSALAGLIQQAYRAG